MTQRLALFAALLCGCSVPIEGVDPTPNPPPPVDPTDPDPDAPPADEPEEEGPDEPWWKGIDDEPVRFVVLGDAGEGNPKQFQVADAMKTVCDKLGCEFALYLGDNFYDVGVDDIDDDQFFYKFEAPYERFDIPFYVVMGNHDLGFYGAGLEFWKTDIYVEYTKYSTRWTMPQAYYGVETRNVKMFGLDTTSIFFDRAEDQQAWLDAELTKVDRTTTDWVLAFGHHPYISNGRHGNAGDYEDVVPDIPLPGLGDVLDYIRGEDVKDFMDASVCGKVDIYFAGHDHNRQWLEDQCGTTFVVSGAGAKTTDFGNAGNPTKFEDDQREGFLWMELDGRQLTGRFFDFEGNEDFTISYEKPPAGVGGE